MLTFLNFHGLGRPPRSLDPGEDEVWLDAGHFVEMLDVVARADAGVRITFDDGNASDVEIALPALADRRMSGSFFVLAGKLGQPGYLSADDVRALADAGMTIGSHGMHHRDWRRLDDSELDIELIEARRVLEDVVGAPVAHVACPFGSYDRRVLARLRSSGYERVYTSDGGRARPRSWLTARTTVTAGSSAASVASLLHHRGGSGLRAIKQAVKRLR